MSLAEDVRDPIASPSETIDEDAVQGAEVGPSRVPFEAFYQDKIVPTLDALDSRHQRALTFLAGGVIAAAFAATFESLELPADQSLLGIIALTLAVGVVPGIAMLSPLAGLAKIGLLEALASAYAVDYDAAGDLPDSYGVCVAFGLLPSAAKCDFKDVISGVRGDVEFTVCQATIRSRDGAGVFRGQFFRLKTPLLIGAPTVILHSAIGPADFVCPQGMKGVGFEDPVANESFRAFGFSQAEALQVLTPPFLQRLNALEDAFKAQKVRCAFTKSEVLITLETADGFMPRALFVPQKRRAAVEGVARRFDQVFKLVDSFNNG